MATDSGFPSSQKVPLGTGITSNHVTVIPTDPYRNAEENLRFAFRVDDDLNARTAGVSTGLDEDLYWVEDTATPARAGDFIRCEDGPSAFLEIPIVKVETNRFLIAINSGLLPVAGNTFFILRYATQRVDETGSQIVIASPGPTQFVLDGLDVEVSQDTVVPSNSIPLPVINLNPNGTEVDPSTATNQTLILAQLALLNSGTTYTNSVRLDYSVTSVTTGAWVELLASVGGTSIKEITLFDGGGFAMELGIGAAASETRILLIPPGGFNGKFKLTIPANSRLSVRAVGAPSVTAGELDINLFV